MIGPNLRIGITGGIGSGKSVAMRIFQCLGARLYSADQRAKWLMENSKSISDQISKVFGPEAYDTNGHLQRSYLAGRIYTDKGLNQVLNSIVHPAVEKDFEGWADAETTAPYLVKEAAILFEAGTYKRVDVIVNIAADPQLRLKRTRARDPYRAATQIQAIMESQLSEDERKSRAHYTLINDGTSSLIWQCIELHQIFINLGSQGKEAINPIATN